MTTTWNFGSRYKIPGPDPARQMLSNSISDILSLFCKTFLSFKRVLFQDR